MDTSNTHLHFLSTDADVLIIRLEARLQPNNWIHFTARFGLVHTFGYRLTSPKVSRFGRNFDYSEYIVGG